MTVSVRYIVDDVEAAVRFYTEHLGFKVEMGPAPGFAALSRGELRLFLNRPGAGGAGQPDAEGRMPQPGGWNRFQVVLQNLPEAVTRLRAAGCKFRNSDIIHGNGGDQIVLEDPAGNAIELFRAASRSGLKRNGNML